MNIDGIIYYIKELAAKKLVKDKELNPKAYFIMLYPEQNKPVYYPVDILDFFPHQKNEIPDYIRYAWHEVKKKECPPGTELMAVIVASDGWLAVENIKGMSDDEIKRAAKNYVRPSLRPNRREAIIITICSKEERFGFFLPYKRVNNKIRFETEVKGNASPVETWMQNLYPHKPLK